MKTLAGYEPCWTDQPSNNARVHTSDDTASAAVSGKEVMLRPIGAKAIHCKMPEVHGDTCTHHRTSTCQWIILGNEDCKVLVHLGRKLL